MSPAPVSTSIHTDGRRLRRQAGRNAVIAALIELLLEGHDSTTPELLAERAGVSVASVFRYFDGLDDLRAQAVVHYFDRYDDLFRVPHLGEGAPATRIHRLVSARVTQHSTTEPVARVVRREARSPGVLADALTELRKRQATQLRVQFAPELAAVSRAAGDDLVAVVAALTSFEAWEQMRHAAGRSDSQIRRAWNTALERLLTPP